MKQSNHSHYHFFWLIILPVIFFYSCDSYHFSRPQPADRENIDEFPKEFQGKWFVEEEGDKDLYQINKKNVLLIFHEENKIVNGAWPKLNDKGEFIKLSGTYRGFKTINYDSLQKPMDTVNNYLLQGEFIYEFDAEKFLSKGYSYATHQDTITVFKYDTICIDLGQNAFLRKLNENFYVFNMRNRILGESKTELSDWWQVRVLEKNGNNSLKIWECNSKSKDLSCMFFPKDSAASSYYFDCKWTAADLLNLINTGYFEVSNKLHRKKQEQE